MNKLPIEKRVQIINLLVEGNSLRSISRVADVSINTLTKLLVDIGSACWKFHDEKVVNLNCRRIQCDEIWSFGYSKEKNKLANVANAGDVWTWTAIDADSKLIVGWFVGNWDGDSANTFMQDIDSRLARRVQLTTDGLHSYLEAVTDSFGSQIDFAHLDKLYGKEGSSSNAEKNQPLHSYFSGVFA